MKKIIKENKYGYFHYEELPSKEFLNNYYSKKYFDENSSYSALLDPFEIKFFKNEANFLLDYICEYNSENINKIIEVGFGQGFLVGCGIERNIDIIGYDYSKNQIHESIKIDENKFIKSNEPINEIKKDDYDCVILKHVIEHVLDPVNTIEKISASMNSNAILIIECPLDFSGIQDYLIKNNKVDEEYWRCYPDHLSFFKPDSISNILLENSFEIEDKFGDFPIETLLFEDNFNYVLSKNTNGKPAHHLRCKVMNYLYETVEYKRLINLFRSWLDCLLSRSFTIVARKI